MSPRPLLILLCAAAVAAAACEANLETTCEGGDGTCDGHQPATATNTGGAGVGGNADVYVLPADCFDGCDTMNVSGNVGEFPCAVQEVFLNCQRCHTAVGTPIVAAPFVLDTYADSQQLYGATAIWSQFARVFVDIPDFMPLQDPKLTPAEKRIMLDDWACKCAPPRAAGEMCP